jgi:hypothetical protein
VSNPLAPHLASRPTRRLLLLSLVTLAAGHTRTPSAAGYKARHARARAPVAQTPSPPPVAASPRHRATTFCSRGSSCCSPFFFVSSSFRSRAAPRIGGGTVGQRRRAREEGEDERSQVRLPLPGARYIHFLVIISRSVRGSIV